MKFLFDENVDLSLAAHLRSRGHDVTTITRDHVHGLEDHEVLVLANAEGRILITNDRDFGSLVVQEFRPHSGIILFRLGGADRATKLGWLDYVLTGFADELHEFLVVTLRGVRVRHAR